MAPGTEADEKENLISRTRLHWHSYVARGGFNEPKLHVGTLEKGGLEHWSSFLAAARLYLKRWPKEQRVLEAFIPTKMFRLITGA